MLRALDHPLSAEIRAFTKIYLEARFSREVITEELQREFDERVKAVRTKTAALASTPSF